MYVTIAGYPDMFPPILGAFECLLGLGMWVWPDVAMHPALYVLGLQLFVSYFLAKDTSGSGKNSLLILCFIVWAAVDHHFWIGLLSSIGGMATGYATARHPKHWKSQKTVLPTKLTQ